MDLFFNKFLSNIPVTQVQPNKLRFCPHFLGNTDTSKDTFEKTPATDGAAKTDSKKSTSKGKDLRELDNITCPYSGIKMISSDKMEAISKELSRCENYHEMLDVVGKYESRMQKHEKRIYHMFREYERTHPNGSFHDCLQGMRPNSLYELRIEEDKVLDEINSLSDELEIRTAFNVRKLTAEAKVKIFNDKQGEIFRRKDLLRTLKTVTADSTKQDVVKEMNEVADKLPKAKNNLNAFVVKYANYDEEYIARRLLYPSSVSIEHIRPFSPDTPGHESGENDMTNFMLTACDWNSARGSSYLPDFIKKHPNIPKYSQRYINDIIKAIEKKKLKNYKWYPYVVKERLYNESEGLINLDLSKYKFSEDEAFEGASQDVVQKYADLVRKNRDIYPKTPGSESKDTKDS